MGKVIPEPMHNPDPATYDTARPYRADLSHLTDEGILAELRAGNDDALAFLLTAIIAWSIASL